jgi:flagellar hook assembly protein FlgD
MDVLTGENTLKGSAGERIRCYPNPSADISTIEFRGPSGSGSIEISDLSGRKIKTLTCSRKGEGGHAAEWDGKDAAGAMVPAGIYFGSLKTPEAIHRCKIIRR